MTTQHEHDYQIDPDQPAFSVCHSCGEVIDTPASPFAGARELAPQGNALRPVSDDAVAALFEQRPLDVIQWAKALAQNAAYEDNGDDSPELDMVIAILTAQTSEEAFAVTNVRTAEDLCGTEPGGHSPLLQITGARPLKSTFKDGPPCFCIVDAIDKSTGEAFKLSTGGRSVQALILAHVNRGWLPFDAVLVRRLKPTRAGFYPLNLQAGG